MRDYSETKRTILSLSNSKRERAEALLEKIIFIDSEMENLQNILREKGWTEMYSNGATQHGLKKSTEADVYINLSKQYISALKQLDSMLLREEATGGNDELLEFLRDN